MTYTPKTKRSFFDKLLGKSYTPLLEDTTAWQYQGGKITLDLNKIPALSVPNRAVRLEDSSLPNRLLVVRGENNDYYVYINKCTHMGRRIDLDGNGELQCTSINAAHYCFDGAVKSGPTKQNLTTHAVEQAGDTLIITLL